MNRLALYSIASLAAVTGFAIGYVQEGQIASPSETAANELPRDATVVNTDIHQESSRNSLPPGTKPSLVSPLKPVASLKEILDLPSPLHRQGAFKAWLDSIPTTEFEGIFSTLRSRQQHLQLIMVLFQTWGERAPEEGVKFLHKVSVDWHQENAEKYFYKAWGDKDRAGARAWCEKNLRGAALYRALKAFSDKPQNMEAILAINDRNVRYTALQDYFTKKGAENRMLALGEAIKIPISQDRVTAARTLLDQWSESDPASAMLWLKGQKEDVFPADMKSRLENIFFENLVLKDMAAAKRYVADLPVGNNRNFQMDRIAAQLVSDDPESAVAYFEQIKAQDPGAMPLRFFKEWMNADPEKASVRLGEEINRAFQAEGGDRRGMWGVNEMMSGWIYKDPAAAAQFATTLPDVVKADLLHEISRSWVYQDSAKAVQWVQSLPEGQTKNDIIRNMGAAWSEHDATQSREWLNQLPQNSARWAATEGIAISSIDNNPDAALSLVRSISNETERIRVLAKVWKDWAGKNGPSANDWLNNTSLTEAEHAVLTANPNK